MKLGAFSISLNVKDLAASRAFYETLGFDTLGGDMSHNYLIMKNEQTLIGLFQGHIPANTLTFNPGWDQNAGEVEGEWDDVRAIQAILKSAGIALEAETDSEATGPGHIMLLDPDDNAILIDQHR